MTFIGEATVTVADGARRAATDRPALAVVGCSSSGTAATPVLCTSIAHAIETFGHGPLVEAIATIPAPRRGPVVGCRATASTRGQRVQRHAERHRHRRPVSRRPRARATRTASASRSPGRAPTRRRDGCDAAQHRRRADLRRGDGRAYGRVFTVGNTGVGVTFADGTFVVDDVYAITCTAPVFNSANAARRL